MTTLPRRRLPTGYFCSISSHGFAVACLGPQGFALAILVVLDDGIGRRQDAGCGTVVLLQTYDPGLGVVALKVEDIANISAAELVYRLVIVADYAKIAVSFGQLPAEQILRSVGILVFVDQDKAEALLVARQDIGMTLKLTHDFDRIDVVDLEDIDVGRTQAGARECSLIGVGTDSPDLVVARRVDVLLTEPLAAPTEHQRGWRWTIAGSRRSGDDDGRGSF